jgi:peptidoglycan hydrolase-like protein with peptidoglycan-binding domain
MEQQPKGTKRNSRMRQKLLLSTAALLAGIAMASAQGTTGGGMTGGTGGGMTGAGKNAGSTAGHERQPSTQGRNGQSEQGASQQRAQEQVKPGQSQRSDQSGRREQTTGQAGERSSGHATQAQSKSPAGKEQERTTGQSQRQPENNMSQTQKEQSRRTQGQARQHENNMSQTQKEQSGRMQGQTPQHETAGQAPGREQGQFQSPRQGQPQQAQRQSEGSRMALSSEQRTKIRDTVLSGNNVPRVNNLSFAVREGMVVPGNVRVMEVPDSLIAIYPQWRGDEYFVVRDEIVIVDRDRRIVSVVPTGSSGGATEARGSGAINLSQERIRDLQTALSRQGFDIGEVDGRLGPRTERALMEFQKRQGLQATGHFDQRTVEALGISAGGREGNRSEPSSTGQAGSSAQQPSANPRTGADTQQPSANPRTGAGSQGTPGAREPSTSGQSGRPMQQAPGNPGASSNPGAAPDAGANPQSGAGTQMRDRGR